MVKVYKGVETLNMLSKRWMIRVEGGNPIKIIDNKLMYRDESGEVKTSYRDLSSILQEDYIVYSNVKVGDWVKFMHPTHPEMIYGKITFIKDQKEVTLKGYEGCRFSIDICEKITAAEAWEQRYAKVFEWKGRKAHELKIGDIVRVSGTNIMATIQKVLDNGLITLDGHGGTYSKEQLMVVAFVDDTIKFPYAVGTRNSFQKIIDNEQAKAPQGGIYNG
ncbi:hypothetical protein BC01_050 [Bacillus phage BC01]|nr:hypothetical protein PBC6_042 [Bacillus phage PBC6]AXU41147.1 hypothetical protein BC01_050 [Bacillus phage BC01]